jgi:acylphosphatase
MFLAPGARGRGLDLPLRGLAGDGMAASRSPIVHWHLVARGRVQGVFYRARVAEAARRHGLVGAVANLPDGTVFIDVQGRIDRVEAFVRDVHGVKGASDARVVERIAEVAIASDLSVFSIR